MNTPNPDPNIAWQVVLTIGVLIAIGVNVISALRSNRVQKREVTFEFTPASKDEFDQFSATANANFVQIREELKQDRHDNQVHMSMRQAKIFEEIKSTRNELLTKHDELRSQMQVYSQDTERALGRIEGKLDEITS